MADFIGESNFLEGRLSVDDGRATFRLADGTTVPAPTPAAARRNGHMSLMVRPESLGVGRQAPSGPVAPAVLAGRATNIAFMGNHTRITVQTDAGVLVCLRFHGESGEQAAEEEMLDREVQVWWDPRESTVVAGVGDHTETEEDPGGGVEG